MLKSKTTQSEPAGRPLRIEPRLLSLRKASFTIAGLLLLSVPAWAQTSPCDLNNDGKVDTTDVNLAVTMALGTTSCTANIAGANVCNVVVVQRVVNAANGGACITTGHSVSLSWTASTSSNVKGYNIYRGTTSGGQGPYAIVNSSIIAGTTYTDSTVQAGLTYFYVATTVDNSNNESGHSTEATAVIPYP